ncbi:DUF4231 domain-containing protein [Neptunomonas sp. CHC150]|uniref:DUF4231 domain-containing protein n=1 Tax=Neptunomonas sp. CHC150 TaxID=2998324 RepID=UPI0025B155EF|nr:DUF4231 domain-containing protein [Neptunomonas sp. CHC150]MDN2660389.1 DUF4231 domain-containing protein [Neptunomonas sp. CHC150]
MQMQEDSFPGLYQSADKASFDSQNTYYLCLSFYLGLLVIAAAVSFFVPVNTYGALVSALLFLVTLGILIYLKTNKPDDIWYNGRAVAESVKTLSWKWMMKAEPFHKDNSAEADFIADLKSVLKQNQSLSAVLSFSEGAKEPITDLMRSIRSQSFDDRKTIYKNQRIDDQADWYAKKAIFNRKRASSWFRFSVLLHGAAIIVLIYRVYDPSQSLPVEVIATAASAVLTWIQAKKHNELSSSYSLAAHEIGIIKSEWQSVTEIDFSDFVINTENAFSREHTQWIARKVDA